MAAREVNFDGIVGPTHNYAGLSLGNLASTRHQQQVSNPRQAALQGLEKMKRVHDLGVEQAVLPPLRRPHSGLLRQLGFSGSVNEMIQSAWSISPGLVAACFSASSMWTANAATVSPSADCGDGKLHLTPANLASGLHRSIEAPDTKALLDAVFSDCKYFTIHDPLPCSVVTADEGAANHTRLCQDYGDAGIEVFVFGRSALDATRPAPEKYPARQTQEASQSVSRLHQLDANNTVLIQQNPSAIDAGVFHNDVIAVGNRNFLMYHQCSFLHGDSSVSTLRQMADKQGWQLHTICFSEDELPLTDAVSSYLFNSQLLSVGDGRMTLLCPHDVQQVASAKRCIDRLLSEDNPVDQVEFLDLRQSMNNGGGPACLRLRVVLTDVELSAIHQSVRFDKSLYARLSDWVNKNYRNELAPQDLCDPHLIDEVNIAFRELQSILQLPDLVFRF